VLAFTYGWSYESIMSIPMDDLEEIMKGAIELFKHKLNQMGVDI